MKMGKQPGGTTVEKVSTKGAKTMETGYPKDCSDYHVGGEKGKDLPVKASGAAGGYGASTERGD